MKSQGRSDLPDCYRDPDPTDTGHPEVQGNPFQGQLSRRASAVSITGWSSAQERRRVRKVQRRASADAHQLHLDHGQDPAAHYRVDGRQVGKGAVVDRVHRHGNPFKPAKAGSLTWTCRIDDGGRDQLAEGGNEAAGALDLLTNLVVGHLDIGHHVPSSSGGSPRPPTSSSTSTSWLACSAARCWRCSWRR